MSVPMDASSQSATPAPGRPTPLLPPNGYMNRRLPQTGRSYDITPDGRRFVRLKTTDSEARAPSAANFTVITNWLQELERQVAAD